MLPLLISVLLIMDSDVAMLYGIDCCEQFLLVLLMMVWSQSFHAIGGLDLPVSFNVMLGDLVVKRWTNLSSGQSRDRTFRK